MLLKVEHKKAELNGQEVFVPDFARMSMKDRNKVNNYADRYQESDDGPGWRLLIVPLLLMVGMAGAVQTNGNIIFVAILFVTLSVIGAFCFGGLAYMIYDVNRKPPLPKAEMVRKDDIRWRMLMVAFADNHEMWERFVDAIRANRYWTPKYIDDSLSGIEVAVSHYMTAANPTSKTAWLVRATVQAIFADYDVMVAERKAVREAEACAEAEQRKFLFDTEVQMARDDAKRRELSSPFLNF